MPSVDSPVSSMDFFKEFMQKILQKLLWRIMKFSLLESRFSREVWGPGIRSKIFSSNSKRNPCNPEGFPQGSSGRITWKNSCMTLSWNLLQDSHKQLLEDFQKQLLEDSQKIILDVHVRNTRKTFKRNF